MDKKKKINNDYGVDKEWWSVVGDGMKEEEGQDEKDSVEMLLYLILFSGPNVYLLALSCTPGCPLESSEEKRMEKNDY